jgi:hypothetical protein
MNKDKVITLAAGAILTTFVGLGISQIRAFVEPKWLMFSVYLVFSFFAVALGLIAYFRSEERLNESLGLHLNSVDRLDAVENSLNFVRNLIENRTKLSWILSTEQMLVLEREKEASKHIWIVTDCPESDTGDSLWVPVIQNNIADGITYTYICPNKTGVATAINGLKDVFRNMLGQCNVTRLPVEEFDRLPYRHIVIYDPDNEAGEMDILCEIDAEETGWWSRISRQKRNYVIDIIRHYTEDASPLGVNVQDESELTDGSK